MIIIWMRQYSNAVDAFTFRCKLVGQIAILKTKTRGFLQVMLPERDSQKNSGLSRSNLKSFRASLTVKEIADIDGVLKDCGLPTCEAFPLTSEAITKALELSWRVAAAAAAVSDKNWPKLITLQCQDRATVTSSRRYQDLGHFPQMQVNREQRSEVPFERSFGRVSSYEQPSTSAPTWREGYFSPKVCPTNFAPLWRRKKRTTWL